MIPIIIKKKSDIYRMLQQNLKFCFAILNLK